MLLRTKAGLLLAVIAAGACESTYPTAQMPSVEKPGAEFNYEEIGLLATLCG